MSYRIVSPRIMQIGDGSISELPHILRSLGYRVPMIVTDIAIAGLGITNRVSQLLDTYRIRHEIFQEIQTEPTITAITAGVTKALAGNNDLFPEPFDCIIALGGGSTIDIAKAIGRVAESGFTSLDTRYHTASTDGLPIIAIPTAISGSETSKYSFIKDNNAESQITCTDLGFNPVAVIVDSELNRSLSPRMIADSGLAALARGIESFVSRNATPYSDLQALTAIRLISQNLRPAVLQKNNTTARQAIMLGANLAGSAFSITSGALLQSMSNTLQSFCRLPHNLANAMLLPAITAFSASSTPERYANCARTMGIATDKDSDEAAIKKLIAALETLYQELKLPSLSAYGVEQAYFHTHLEQMTEQVIASDLIHNHPRIPTREEIIFIYEKLWHTQ
ncbi:Alcohol dehydrogenase, class IV [Amphritea atlantica]|uniref:Alcohol dehydrogenase, class IV n=1 Tax=Amphritea atlantica TaxID=355243 RepID=A0A1H9M526_9GAMM|nr:iron-containing alcohol dehydrogenase [Amphritea atlantica]SER18736.1 Alcohol dehydrogenase, class IV [Amphritea atlantica]